VPKPFVDALLLDAHGTNVRCFQRRASGLILAFQRRLERCQLSKG
jgi:hypothetical protein